MAQSSNKVTLGWPNRIEQAAVEGGNWLSTLPIQNVQKMPYSKKARTDGILSNSEDSANWIRNNTFIGAVAGTPGTNPQYWGITLPSGCTQQIVGFGVENGIEYMDFKCSGTCNATNQYLTFFPDTPTSTPASYGETWTASWYIKLIAGSLANLTPRIAIEARTAVGALLSGLLTEIAVTPTGAALDTQRYSHTDFLDNPFTERLRTAFYSPVANGAVIDVTFRIGLPQLEKKSAMTEVMRTYGAVVSRTLPSQFKIKLDKKRSIGVLALAAHNLSPAAQLRIRAYDNYDRAAWDIETDVKTITNSPSFSAQDNTAISLQFSLDGTKCYMLGYTTKTVYQYTLGTAWDETTAVYSGKSFSVNTQEANPTELFIKPDGTTFYIVGIVNKTVYQYTLGTAWDISTASYAVLSSSVSAQATTPQGMTFRNNGLTMYINDLSKVYQYTLGTAWDISTAAYASKQLNVVSIEPEARSIYFSPDYTSLYLVGTYNDSVYQFSLTTAGDIATASYTGNFYKITQEPNPQGLYFKYDGSEFYVIGSTNNRVYHYKLNLNPVYDSGVINAWPDNYLPEAYQWGDVGWWEAGGNLPDLATRYTPLTTIFFGQSYSTSSLLIEIYDADNNSGYVEIGRIFVSDTWQPEINALLGVSHGMIDESEVQKSLSGTEYSEQKRVKRTVDLDFKYLTDEEAFQGLYPAHRDLGITKEILYAFEINPSGEFYHRTFIGRFARPDPISNPLLATNKTALSIQEII